MPDKEHTCEHCNKGEGKDVIHTYRRWDNFVEGTIDLHNQCVFEYLQARQPRLYLYVDERFDA